MNQALAQQAAELILAILNTTQSTESLFQQYFRAHRQLGKKDRSQLADMVMNGFRYLGKVEGNEDLINWLHDYERENLSAFPASWQRNLTEWLLAQPDSLPIESKTLVPNMPDWLWHKLASQPNESDAQQQAYAYQQRAPLDIRIHPWRTSLESIETTLQQAGFITERLPQAPFGLRLTSSQQTLPSLNRLPCFTQGEIALQDLGSQWICQALPLKGRGGLWVDYCAGAGGKTLGLIARLHSTNKKKNHLDHLLLACDTQSSRLSRLNQRTQLALKDFALGLSVETLVLPALSATEALSRLSAIPLTSKRYLNRANGVLVDAPCTGLGTLRRAPDLAWRLRPASIQHYSNLQKNILNHASQWIVKGGVLLYATCSWLAEENQEVVNEFLAHNPNFSSQSFPKMIEPLENPESCGQASVSPSQHKSDGYFWSLMVRNQ